MWNALKSYAQKCHARILTVELGREEGQALTEYALILALVSVVAVLALTELGGAIAGVLENVVTEL